MRKGWTFKRLGDVCTIERGGSPRPIEAYITDSPDGLNWIKIGDATDGSKYITSTKEKIKPEGLKKTRLVHKGDFILSNSMSFGRPYILAIDGCIHDGWLVLRDDEDTFDKSYLYYVLSSPTMFREFKKLAVGGVVNNLNTKLVQSVVVAIPPRHEQVRIVAELDLLQGIIDKQKAQLKELDTLAQSTFYDMFGDPVENKNNWEEKSLGEVCMLKAGKSIKASELSATSYEGAYPCYGGNGIRGYIAKKSHEGTFPIIGRQGALCGNVNLASGSFYATEHAVVCTPNHLLQPLFLFYALTAMNLNQYAKGVAQPGLAVGNITPLPIVLPPLPLQQDFADKIEAIEQQKSLITQSIAETQKLFDYTMDKYFG